MQCNHRVTGLLCSYLTDFLTRCFSSFFCTQYFQRKLDTGTWINALSTLIKQISGCFSIDGEQSLNPVSSDNDKIKLEFQNCSNSKKMSDWLIQRPVFLYGVHFFPPYVGETIEGMKRTAVIILLWACKRANTYNTRKPETNVRLHSVKRCQHRRTMFLPRPRKSDYIPPVSLVTVYLIIKLGYHLQDCWYLYRGTTSQWFQIVFLLLLLFY